MQPAPISHTEFIDAVLDLLGDSNLGSQYWRSIIERMRTTACCAGATDDDPKQVAMAQNINRIYQNMYPSPLGGVHVLGVQTYPLFPDPFKKKTVY